MYGQHLTVFPDNPTSEQRPGPLGPLSLTYNRSSPTVKRGKQCCFKRTHFRRIHSLNVCFTYFMHPVSTMMLDAGCGNE